MLYIILFLTLIYFGARISVLIKYLVANKTFHEESIRQYQIEVKKDEELNATFSRLSGNSCEQIPSPPHFPQISQDSQNKWVALYKLDFKIKSIGTILISILAIALLIFNISTKDKTLLLTTAILPSIVQLFNEIISWFEIEKPIGFEPILPKRFLARKIKP